MSDAKAPGPATGPLFCAAEARPRILAAAIVASAMGFIDSSVVAIAVPAMREVLDASLAEAQWVSAAYLVALSALILTGGALGDRFGTARVFRIGIITFTLTSLLCAIAPTAPLMIGARALQGAAAALMVPGSLAILARAYPRDVRGRAIGIWAGASSLTTAIGPILGGQALTWFGPEAWRAIFALNLPLGALALWLLLAVRHDSPATARRLDVPGSILATLSLGALALGLSGVEDGGRPSPFLLALGAALFAVFLTVEARSAAPMMPLGLFRHRSFAIVNTVTLTLWCALTAILFFLPMVLVAGRGLSESWTSVAYLPLPIALVLLSGRFGALADKWGPGPVIAAGASVVTLGYLCLGLAFLWSWGGFWWGVVAPMAVAALGMAMVVAPLSAAVMLAVSDADSGIASGINNAVARAASLIAVAAAGPIATAAYAAAGGSIGFGLPGDGAATDAGFAAVALAAAALAGLSALLCLSYRDRQTGT